MSGVPYDQKPLFSDASYHENDRDRRFRGAVAQEKLTEFVHDLLPFEIADLAIVCLNRLEMQDVAEIRNMFRYASLKKIREAKESNRRQQERAQQAIRLAEEKRIAQSQQTAVSEWVKEWAL